MRKLKHQVLGMPASPYRPLDESAVRRIADAALTVLEESGMAVYSDTAMEALRAAGAKVDGESRVVRFTRSLVEDAVDSSPSSITLFSRDGEHDAVLERDRVHYSTGGTAIYVLDPDTGTRRPSTVEDVVLNARMVDALENIHAFTINVFPNEIQEKDDIDVNPKLANRQKRDGMSPDDDALPRAKLLVDKIRSSRRCSRLSADVRERVLESFPEIRPTERELVA